MQESNKKTLKSQRGRKFSGAENCHDGDTEEENFHDLRVICNELKDMIQKQGSWRENKKGIKI